MTRLTQLTVAKEVVVAVMKFEERETRAVMDKTTEAFINCTFLKYRCLLHECPKPLVVLMDEVGYRNTHQHLKTCYRRGKRPAKKDKLLQDLYLEARSVTEKKRRVVLLYFGVSDLSLQDITVHDIQ